MYTTKYLLIKKIGPDQSLMVNTLSGAIDLIDNRLARILKTPNKITDSIILKKLRQRGYIYDSPEEEQELLNNLYKRYAEQQVSPVLVICPTHTCNLRCKYCFEKSMVSTSTELMGPEDVDYLFDAFSIIDEKAKQLQLFGGEPLLPTTYPVVKKILQKAKRRGFQVDVVTNGVNISNYIHLIKQYSDLFGSFQVTLDGPQEIHDRRRVFASGQGTFDKIISGINLLIHNGVRVAVRANVDADNIDYLPRLADIFDSQGWIDSPNFHCALAPVNDHKGDLDHTNLLSEDIVADRFLELRRRHVNLGRINHQLFRNLDHIITALDPSVQKPTLPRFKYCESNSLECYAFGADGYIYACSETIGEHDLAIGKFKPKFELWDEKVAMWDNRSILTLDKCRDCNIATLCGGGCAYAALSINGTQDNPVCQNAPQVVDSYLESIKNDLLKKVG